MKQKYLLFSLLLSLFSSYAAGDCWGKLDVSPAYIHLDILQSRKTIKKMDMQAIRIDANAMIYSGFYLKPSFTYGTNCGEFYTGSLGLGFCYPVNDRWTVSPSAGVTYTYLNTNVKLDVEFLGPITFDEDLEATAPWIGLEVIYKIRPCLRLSAMAQYAWSHSHTTLFASTIIPGLGAVEIKNKSKSDSGGPNFGVLLEYDITDSWSINVGAGYNISLDREKHGIRGYGIKTGLAYWFGV